MKTPTQNLENQKSVRFPSCEYVSIDILQGLGIKEAYGPAIILFTVGVKAALFPITYKQLESAQMMQVRK